MARAKLKGDAIATLLVVPSVFLFLWAWKEKTKNPSPFYTPKDS